MEEEEKPQGMTKNEIEIIAKCIKGTVRVVVKDPKILSGRLDEAAANAVGISIGFLPEWGKPIDYAHFLFIACSNHVQVYVSWSRGMTPSKSDDFIFAASHDSTWAESGLYRLQKKLAAGPYKLIASYDVSHYKIEPHRYRYSKDRTVAHMLDRTSGTFCVRQKESESG